MTQYPMLQSLLSPFRRSRQKTLALVIAAIAEVAQAASLAVAGHLAAQPGIKLGSALTRVQRLLRQSQDRRSGAHDPIAPSWREGKFTFILPDGMTHAVPLYLQTYSKRIGREQAGKGRTVVE